MLPLHQICITASGRIPAELPETLQTNVDSFRHHHPDAPYEMWCASAIRSFIFDHFDTDTLMAYDALLPFSYKCDLARLCVLYESGGLYADLGLRFDRSFSPPAHIGFAAFRSMDFLTPSWTTVSNGIIYATPRRREIELSIEMIIESCRNGYYGETPLHPTGPVLFGRAVAKAMVERLSCAYIDDQWIGVVNRKADDEGDYAHVAPDGATVARNVKRGRSLAQMGLIDTNGYAESWHDRRAYGP